MSDDRIKVLFVCLGNICRSPMAEAVFAHTVAQRNLQDHFLIDSAGTASYHVGSKPDPRSAATCRAHGVPVNHHGRQVQTSDFKKFDYILCMDESNLHDLRRKRPIESHAEVALFGSFSDRKEDRIIEDPYYGGQDGFETNFSQVTRCSEGLLKKLGF
ncbi:Low molecular weight phosphotyrosine protein phosphatase [Linderina macrospora]|uniref:Low molecular weight phosphotyrosine protein phosphatase n=1 Tax=Linderina macrospora TaxID=4868 RepID=A0ACC1JFT3_9FUNG|nr:Low molecular weight phosphotyrosine protein phosphatase [Linderina macrospora]